MSFFEFSSFFLLVSVLPSLNWREEEEEEEARKAARERAENEESFFSLLTTQEKKPDLDTFFFSLQKHLNKNRIKKCRYLQESGCVGLCTNLCKRPTEAFFADAFGLPLTMEPDFETLECTMRFGQLAPPIEEDAVYNQPCFSAVCSMASPSGPCPKIDTDRAK